MYKLQHQQAGTMQQSGHKSNYQNDDFTKFAGIENNAAIVLYNNKG